MLSVNCLMLGRAKIWLIGFQILNHVVWLGDGHFVVFY